jgi:hypothetical protein
LFFSSLAIFTNRLFVGFPTIRFTVVVKKGEAMNKKLQKLELDAAIIEALVQHSDKTYLQLAKKFGISLNYLVGIVQREGLSRKRGRGSPAWPAKKLEVR